MVHFLQTDLIFLIANFCWEICRNKNILSVNLERKDTMILWNPG